MSLLVIEAAALSHGRFQRHQDVVITEIMINPSAVADDSGEWFELYNPTADDLSLQGWNISDNDSESFLIPTLLVLPAGGYVVLGNNANESSNGGVTLDFEYGSSMFLSNSADELIVLDETSVEIDRVAWDSTFVIPEGASLSLEDVTADNALVESWCISGTAFGNGDLGTPGGENVCAPPVLNATNVTIMEIQAGYVCRSLSSFDTLYRLTVTVRLLRRRKTHSSSRHSRVKPFVPLVLSRLSTATRSTSRIQLAMATTPLLTRSSSSRRSIQVSPWAILSRSWEKSGNSFREERPRATNRPLRFSTTLKSPLNLQEIRSPLRCSLAWVVARFPLKACWTVSTFGRVSRRCV